jgi:hypothetical protein
LPVSVVNGKTGSEVHRFVISIGETSGDGGGESSARGTADLRWKDAEFANVSNIPLTKIVEGRDLRG